jgi:CheY-like chemotaxis protein
LGLSISKQLVEVMDGEIGVTSARVEEGAGIESEGASLEPFLESIGPVLVAEDNALIQEILVRQFELLGLRVTVVSDGLQAVEAARTEHFAMIFMDCQMPNMDGFEATKAIREGERSSGEHLPIVAMTASAFREDREACLAAGMDDYLAKPVRLRELRRMIKRWAPE